LAALHDVRLDLAEADSSRPTIFGSRVGPGGAFGLGGIVYVLTRLSQFLGDDGLLDEARQASALLGPQMIDSDKRLDVVFGSAGAILGLLALHDANRDQMILDRVVACGNHLLSARAVSDSGHRAWPTLNGTLLTGFSHGAAGIAYAMLRLYEAAPDLAFLNAASEAIAYERSVFSPQAGNWPDYRYPVSNAGLAFTTSWCHGAPGIVLGRLGGLNILESDDIRQDIDSGLETTRQAALNGVDHLCCGTLGRVETLLQAGHLLSRPELTEVASRSAAGIVTMAKQRGAYLLNGALPKELSSPGFFQGLSGIGYELLRLAEPLPSVLLWE
jgi:lantibiotic modifying enzyme